MAQPESSAYANIPLQEPTYEELRPLQQNVSDDIYDDVAPESRHPPTIMQGGNLPQKASDVERPGCHVRWVRWVVIGLSLAVVLAVVVILHVLNGKNTFSDMQSTLDPFNL